MAHELHNENISPNTAGTETMDVPMECSDVPAPEPGSRGLESSMSLACGPAVAEQVAEQPTSVEPMMTCEDPEAPHAPCSNDTPAEWSMEILNSYSGLSDYY